MKLQDLPVLEGWETLPDAARRLKISRQRIHQLVGKGRFETATRIGTFAIVRTAEVEKFEKNRKLLELEDEEVTEGAA